MSKLTRLSIGKVSNKAINLLANTAGMVATAMAITTSVAVFTQSAEAYTSCSTDSWGNTSCSGTNSNGNSYSGSCSSDSWGSTACY